MPELNFEKEKIPLWNGSDGSIAVTVNSENADAALVPGSNPIVDASFTVDGNGSIGLGSVASVMLTVNSNEHFRLAPLWKDHVEAAPDLAILFSLGDSLTPEEMLLAMSLGASADLSAAGSFKYNILTIGASLAVGTDAALVQVRKYPANTPLGNLFDDFFGKLQLPANVAAPPEPGELIAFEFGGYLNFGVSASAGFEMKGTKSFAARDLKLSEVYGLSVTGKIGAEASLAGRFSV
ncbi:MAG TPA: hypothetical protein VFW83_01855, partial [Bryobacteraceae bacterium]|nr:hypothetical protein [Bryobacteraceae bacterium]